MGLDLVAQDEIGAGMGASGLVELFAERGQRPGAPRGGDRVVPDEQLAGGGGGGGVGGRGGAPAPAAPARRGFSSPGRGPDDPGRRGPRRRSRARGGRSGCARSGSSSPPASVSSSASTLPRRAGPCGR